nr:MAG TPA: hypothetical protein [Caudoviricetes sp.]
MEKIFKLLYIFSRYYRDFYGVLLINLTRMKCVQIINY